MEKWKKVVAVAVVALLLLVVVVAVAVTHMQRCVPSGEAQTWKSGDYKVGDINEKIIHVEDNMATLTYLKFLNSESEPTNTMCWVAKGNNTVEITLDWTSVWQSFEATVSDDKMTITGGPEVLTWITPEEAAVIRNRPKESVLAPKVPYPLRPGQPGKLAIITGPPGSGKSTAAGLIAKNHDWIFYEGDGFMLGFNPYVFPNESQVDARSEKPALFGPGMAARKAARSGFFANWDLLGKNLTTDRSQINHFLRLMAEDIKKEKARVGGDWVVAFAMATRKDRDVFREVLGDDVIFVVLDISFDLVKERLSGRSESDEHLAGVHYIYEPAQSDEPRTVAFEILKDVTREENAQGIYDLINKESAVH